MFADFPEDQDPRYEDLDGASDRELLHGIWHYREEVPSDAAERWAVLVSRYPQEPRFLLCLMINEVVEQGMFVSFDLLAAQAKQVAADERLREPLADVLSLARLSLGRVTELLSREQWAAFDALAEPFGGARRAEREAQHRLAQVQDRILEELHDRTLGNRPLETPRTPAQTRAEDWPALVAKTKDQPGTPYAATVRFQVGAKIAHPVFGVGFVVARREKKIDVLFESGRRTLAGK